MVSGVTADQKTGYATGNRILKEFHPMLDIRKKSRYNRSGL